MISKWPPGAKICKNGSMEGLPVDTVLSNRGL
jgi:hypothetical protein